MITSYGETSGFVAAAVDEQTAVNGGILVELFTIAGAGVVGVALGYHVTEAVKRGK
jgi:hypothetical protein